MEFLLSRVYRMGSNMKRSVVVANYRKDLDDYRASYETWCRIRELYEEDGSNPLPGPRPIEPKLDKKLITECEVDGCEAPPDAKGYCAKHYQAVRRGRDPVLFAPRGRPVTRLDRNRRPIQIAVRVDILEVLATLAVRENTNREDVLNRVLALALDLPEFPPGDPRSTSAAE